MEKRETFRFSTVTKTIWAFNAGIWLMLGLHACEDDTAERVAAVQEHNVQIESQLSHTFPELGRLVLNDESNTFEFHVDEHGTDRTCSGKYSVNDKEKAEPAKKIICRETIEIGHN